MSRIRILPENLTNKIAAGEVVERPASVIKELVENSLDAGCTEVMVEIEAGGKRLIRVTDDGCGMSREDALLSLERHATSKIARDDDLFNLSTLGFRGEAIPSIASVSRFTLSTRPRDQIEGVEIYAEGGKVREVKACGMAEGTSVSVRNLFFNTPARLKFQKSNDTEAGHVGDILARLAISRPDIRFVYKNDGKTVFRLLNAPLRDRVLALLGRSLADGLYPVEYEEAGVQVRGLAARPDVNRSSAGHVYTYINGRFIRDKVVQHAILQAYRNFLERGRYPAVVLFIDLPAGDVDVNVHPTKHEVRFREQRMVHDLIQGAVERVLRATPWLTRAEPPAQAAPARREYSAIGGDSGAERVTEVREVLLRYQPASRTGPPVFPMPARMSDEETEHPSKVAIEGDKERAEPVAAAQGGTQGYFSSLILIGQFHASYLVCQDGADLVLIDQHAAHERVAFERLKTQYAAGNVESQGLLFPETIETSFREAAALADNQEGLTRLGFELEAFGGNTWLLKGTPRILAHADAVRVLRDILEELQSLGKTRVFADLLEDLLARVACHSVVRGSHALSRAEVVSLFASMDATDFSSNCPHGRPVLQRLSLADIERLFKRG